MGGREKGGRWEKERELGRGKKVEGWRGRGARGEPEGESLFSRCHQLPSKVFQRIKKSWL